MNKTIPVKHPLVNTDDVSVPTVLDAAKAACTQVLVLGEEADGKPYMAASVGDTRVILYWLDSFKHRLLSGEFD